jgi:hypothetical protein
VGKYVCMHNQICTCAHDDMCAYGLRQVFNAHRFHPEPRAARASAARRVCRGEPQHVRACVLTPPNPPDSQCRRQLRQGKGPGADVPEGALQGTHRVPAVLTVLAGYAQYSHGTRRYLVHGKGVVRTLAQRNPTDLDGGQARALQSTAEYSSSATEYSSVLQRNPEECRVL